jgi:hypothetical protein
VYTLLTEECTIIAEHQHMHKAIGQCAIKAASRSITWVTGRDPITHIFPVCHLRSTLASMFVDYYVRQAISLLYVGGRPLSLTLLCEPCLYLCRVWKLANRYVPGLRVKEDIRTNKHGGMATAAKLRLTLVQGTPQG